MGQAFSFNFKDYQNLASSINEYFKNFKMENKIISEETIKTITSNLAEGNLDDMYKIIDDVLKKIDNATLNIAVTGENGSGKSSFIHALRDVDYNAKNTAADSVVETTTKPTAYKHPKFPNVVFWELPSIGSPNFQPKEYLKQVKFDKYKFFIIISATQFNDNDIQLAKTIKDMKKNFYFIRSKVDIDLQNEQKYKPKNFDREKVLQTIRNNCLHCFRQNQMDEPQIFMINSNDVSKYDFSILTDTVLKDLSAQKRHIFTLSLPNVTDKIIEQKKNSLKQKVWIQAVRAGFFATFPLGGIISDYDINTVKNSLNDYRVFFGVDDESLKVVATNLKVPCEQLKAVLESPNMLEKEEDKSVKATLCQWLEKYCLVVGGLLAAGFYFGKAFSWHIYILDTVSKDAKILLEKRFSEKK
ncbi:PREDICTED: interferon-inducible GTPase 1-like [Chrysochloris asiatica]|uniref:Interferon-inducible GTPase 1-like n=1 Tax=Chrysochloris asiatica TaxID=185453 RepID=A0A9B0TEK0_CHRAS|nr:PREDICTED: interferon-inducible GTPase 1-like [Chrysochloris asiatica]